MESGGGGVYVHAPAGEQEWYTLLSSFRESAEKRRAVMREYTKEALLSHMLAAICKDVPEADPTVAAFSSAAATAGGGGGASFVEDSSNTLVAELRYNLLVFLQENVRFFIEGQESRLDIVFNNLSKIISSSSTSAAAMFLKGHVLATLTTILLEEQELVLLQRPTLLESFVERLLELSSRVNVSAERHLRAMACHCLEELELAHPCLLQGYLAYFFSFGQEETTHAAQAYNDLFATTLLHKTDSLLVQQHQHHPSSSSSSSSLSASTTSPPSTVTAVSSPSLTSSTTITGGFLLQSNADLKSFTIPITMHLSAPSLSALSLDPSTPTSSNRKNSPSNKLRHSGAMPEAWHKEARRCVSLLVDNVTRLSDYALLSLAAKLVLFIQQTKLSKDVFKHHFFCFLYTDSALLFHLVIMLFLSLPDIFEPSDHFLLLSRLLHLVDEPTIPIQKRTLFLQWLRTMPRLPLSNSSDGEQPAAPLLYPFYSLFYPSVFDEWDIKEAKLLALCSCFKTGVAPPPRSILSCLTCLQEFWYFSANAKPTRIVFRVLQRMLLQFPELFPQLYDYLLRMMLEAPKFLPNIIELVDALERHHTEDSASSHHHNHQQRGSRTEKKTKEGAVTRQSLRRKSSSTPPKGTTSKENKALSLLISFESVLRDLPDLHTHDLSNYLPMIQRIAAVPTINPAALLDRITRYLKYTRWQGEAHQWVVGNDILSICRCMLLHHPARRIFQPLGDLLLFCTRHFDDVDIRDRAHFYYQLLTHVSAESLRAILSSSSSPSTASNSPVLTSQTNGVSAAKAQGPAAPSNDVIEFATGEKDGAYVSSLKRLPTFLSLRRVSSSQRSAAPVEVKDSCNEPQSVNTQPKLQSDREDREDLLSSYFAFQELATKEPIIQLPYVLEYALSAKQISSSSSSSSSSSPSDTSSDAHSSSSPSSNTINNITPSSTNTIPDKIFALVLSFSESPLYENMPEVHIPFVLPYPMTNKNEEKAKEDHCSAASVSLSTTTDEEENMFPYRHNVTIALRPRAPLPVSFQVKATFNDEEGNLCEMDMQPISLHLADLFLPLSFPELLEDVPSQQHRLWDLLWERVLLPPSARKNHGANRNGRSSRQDEYSDYSSSEEDEEAEDSSDEQEEMGAQSVRFIPLPKEEVVSLVSIQLGAFVIRPTTTTTQEEEERKEKETSMKVAIRLAPRYHLLLRFTIHESSTLAYIRTDYWRILPFLDGFFDGLLANHANNTILTN
ncbi:endosomal transport [Balamuthia mandrillaris]